MAKSGLKNNQILITIPLIMILIAPSISATVENQCYEEQENIWQDACNLTIQAIHNGSISNTANCWIKIIFPNSTTSLEMSPMTSSGSDGFYYYPFNFTVLGWYVGYSTCSEDGVNGTSSLSYNSVTSLTTNYLEDINQTVSFIHGNQTKHDLIIYSGGSYNPGEEIKIVANLLKDKETLSGETLKIGVYYPNGLEMASDNMEDLGNGIYKYNTTAPTTTGDYIFNITLDGYQITKGTKFTVSQGVSTIETSIESVGEEIIDETTDVMKQETDNLQIAMQNYMYGLYIGIVEFLNTTVGKIFFVILVIIGFLTVLGLGGFLSKFRGY